MSTAVEGSFVGVRFGEETNLTLCTTGGSIFAQGDEVMVELARGPAYGHVERSPMPVFKPCQKNSARPIIRPASNDDASSFQRKVEKEVALKIYCRERSRNLGLKMKISRVDFALNGRSAVVYFTAEGRIDFRRLVKDLSRKFSAKIKMTQVGARDEAALLGGIGVCGRTLCCSSWLKDFRPISIQMAKRQNLSLNPSKISGQCGRLLCCLAYENDQYERPPRKKRRPARESTRNP